MVQLLLSHGANLLNALRWLDDTLSKQGGLLDYYPSFQILDAALPLPLGSLHAAETLDKAIVMAAQLGTLDPKIDSIAWEWEVPSAIESQSWDLSLENAVMVMQNPLRDPQWALSDHFLAMTWDEWLADCTPARERDAIANFLALLMAAASKVKGGVTGQFTLLGLFSDAYIASY
jgi:hypothetical protein